MNKLSRYLLGLSLVVTCSCVTTAQEKSQAATSIPMVLQITREYTKPGKSGMVHEKTESAFVQAMARAKWPTHYLGMTSLSGKQRALFLTSYDSFEAWEKDNAATAKNAGLSAALDRDGEADGELLDSIDQTVFIYHEEMSLRPKTDMSHMRYMEFSVYHVRPGHDREWSEVVKMAKAADEKAVPNSHWAMFEQVFGGDGGTYVVLTSHKTLAEVDSGFQDDKLFEAAIGEDGMKKLNELFGQAVDSTQQQLFSFDPHMSYVADEWTKADPDFWKPKTVTAPAVKPATQDAKPQP
jgi:hypothetical protein